MTAEKKYKIYVPRDSSSLAVGADKVYEAIQREAIKRGVEIEIKRNGSRGAYWLEPLVEVETDRGRIGYAKVSPEDIPYLFDKKFFLGDSSHKLYVGIVDGIDFFRKQTRINFERVGIIDPLSLDEYKSTGGFLALQRVLSMKPQDVIVEIKKSGLRGRGGGGFPTGIKWETVFNASSDKKYIVCNADEGDSGTFSDRMIMEGNPFLLIEGILIAGIVLGADEGYIYLRSEYPLAREILNQAIHMAYEKGYLGEDILGTGKKFDLEVYVGAGSYVCGEETALIESLEGKRGLPRTKPPFPAVKGLWERPTLVNNVNTFAAVPWIIREGADKYASYGQGNSRGTIAIQLSGNVKRGGLIEVPFGISLNEIIYDFGGGTASGKSVKAVLVGGPLGIYLPEKMLDIPITFEAFSSIGGTLGHGSVVVFDQDADMGYMAKFAMEFCFKESCGKCAPCRIGSARALEILDKILNGKKDEELLNLLRDLADVMMNTSLCGLGAKAPSPVLSIIKHFPGELGFK